MNKKTGNLSALNSRFATIKNYHLYHSLTIRVLAISTLLAFVALIIAATIIQGLYAASIEKRFDETLKAQLFNVITSVSLNDEKALIGAPNLGDTRYNIPGSGWYWQVRPASPILNGRLNSTSLSNLALPKPQVDVDFNDQFERRFFARNSDGKRLRAIETEYILGDDNEVALFSVMGSFAEVEAEQSTFKRRLWLLLGVLGLAVIAINTIAIISGMRPLDRARRALLDIREGRAQSLEGPFPSEIQPLADELNALIDNNRRIVERSRTQVGNLAHSLKTPLAVLINEGRRDPNTRLITEQAEAMQVQVQHYLQKARIAAQRNSVVFRTPVRPIVERLARVVEKLNPHKVIEVDIGHRDFIFPGEREDLEEIIGNLVENAAKWAHSTIKIDLRAYSVGVDGGLRFMVRVSDDGDGIPKDKWKAVLMRGHRLDETTPGTGLGLSIVTDLIDEYGGELKFAKSPMGGLEVSVILQRSE